MDTDKYVVNRFDLGHVRNYNEERVIEVLREKLSDFEHFMGCQLCTEDVYALSVKQLPPQYIQMGSIVLNKNVSDEDVIKTVMVSIGQVLEQPNHE
ncbi:MAG: late competence development ComFB family protein [Proteobacteria bacterium]|nr:late competence development ComFB family protein [Pseudomonadota bacterium]